MTNLDGGEQSHFGATAKAAKRMHFPTETAILLPMLAALIITAVLLFAIQVQLGTQNRTWALLAGSWVQVVELWLFFWVTLLLVRKYLLIEDERKRIRFVERKILPTIFATRVSRDEVPYALELLRSHIGPLGIRDLLSARIEQVLIALGISGVPGMATEIMRELAGLDRDRSDATYTVVRVLLWALPILGFIGTVLGIGNSVAEFSTFISQAKDMHAISMGMREQLGGVTRGLAVAFDTTLLGLLFSIPGVFAMAILRRREDALLTDAEQYCLDSVAPMLAARPVADDRDESDSGAINVRTELDNLAYIARDLKGVVREMIAEFVHLTTRAGVTQQGASGSE